MLGLKLKIKPCSNETGTMSLERPIVLGVPFLLPAPPPPLRNGGFIFERDKIIEKILKIADAIYTLASLLIDLSGFRSLIN
jgi:hypothetical protein